MIRKIAFAATAVLITASPLAYAAETSSTTSNASTTEMRHPTSEDLKALTDARVGITKAALQLTPEQEKILARPGGGHPRRWHQTLQPLLTET